MLTIEFQELEDLYGQFKMHNESKNIFKAARTPAVFFAAAVIFYILSGIFGLVGMYSLANICNLVMGAAMLSLGVWAYIRWDIFCCYTYVFSVVVLCVVGLSNQFLFLVESLMNENWQLVWCFSVQSKVQVLVSVEVLVCCVQHEWKFYLNVCLTAWKLCILYVPV